MVLDLQQRFEFQVAQNRRVDTVVIRRGELAHQLHRRPVFRAGTVHRQPSQMSKFLRDARVHLLGHLAVIFARHRARAA